MKSVGEDTRGERHLGDFSHFSTAALLLEHSQTTESGRSRSQQLAVTIWRSHRHKLEDGLESTSRVRQAVALRCLAAAAAVSDSVAHELLPVLSGTAGTSGILGGLSASVHQIVRACDAAAAKDEIHQSSVDVMGALVKVVLALFTVADRNFLYTLLSIDHRQLVVLPMRWVPLLPWEQQLQVLDGLRRFVFESQLPLRRKMMVCGGAELQRLATLYGATAHVADAAHSLILRLAALHAESSRSTTGAAGIAHLPGGESGAGGVTGGAIGGSRSNALLLLLLALQPTGELRQQEAFLALLRAVPPLLHEYLRAKTVCSSPPHAYARLQPRRAVVF